MAGIDINLVVLGGRLTKDPELRYTPAGKAVTQFTIASSNGTFNEEEDTNFVPVVTWNKLAENVANYCKKGRQVTVEGRINTRHYDNNEGKRVYVTEIIATKVVFGSEAGAASEGGGNGNSERGSSASNRGSNQPTANQGGNQDPFSDDGRPIDISDDDLPF